MEDLINGIIKLMNSGYNKPMNLGNPSVFTIKEISEKVKFLIYPKLNFYN